MARVSPDPLSRYGKAHICRQADCRSRAPKRRFLRSTLLRAYVSKDDKSCHRLLTRHVALRQVVAPTTREENSPWFRVHTARRTGVTAQCSASRALPLTLLRDSGQLRFARRLFFGRSELRGAKRVERQPAEGAMRWRWAGRERE